MPLFRIEFVLEALKKTPFFILLLFAYYGKKILSSKDILHGKILDRRKNVAAVATT